MHISNRVARSPGWSVRASALVLPRLTAVVQAGPMIAAAPPSKDPGSRSDAHKAAAVLARIRQVPGRHMRGLQRDLEMCLGTLEHHLRALEREGAVTTRATHGYKAYFPAEGMDRRDRDLLCHLRHENRMRIVALTLLGPGSTLSDLSRTLAIAPSSCSFHLGRLVDAGVMTTRTEGRWKRLSVADPDRVVKLLRAYPDTFPKDLLQEIGRIDRSVGVAVGS